MLTAALYPGLMGVIFLFINSFVAYWGSSTAAPLTTLLSLMLLWFGVSTPLVFVGSFFGFKREAIPVPLRTNQIARHIPEQPWYLAPAFSIAAGGVLPFGTVCIELFFLMSAMWLHQVRPLSLRYPPPPLALHSPFTLFLLGFVVAAQLYLVFGFLVGVLLILVVTCAEITIVMCYFQL